MIKVRIDTWLGHGMVIGEALEATVGAMEPGFPGTPLMEELLRRWNAVLLDMKIVQLARDAGGEIKVV